jgi:hypothetical protein
LNQKIESGFAAEIAEGAGKIAETVERAGEFGADNARCQDRVVLGLRAKAEKKGNNGVERFRSSIS